MFDIKEHFMMTLAAPRWSGKSFLIGMLLDSPKFLKRFEHVIILCFSTKLNNDYLPWVDNDKFTILDTITDEILDELFTKQTECMKRVRKREREEKDKPKLSCPNTLLILDDCVDSGVLTFRGTVDKLAERGRHMNMSTIVSAQRISSISRGIRTNSDYFLIFSPFTIGELEQFIEQFVAKSQRKEAIQTILNIFETKYEFILIDNTEPALRKLKSSNAEDFVKGIVRPLFPNGKVEQGEKRIESPEHHDLPLKKHKTE